MPLTPARTVDLQGACRLNVFSNRRRVWVEQSDGYQDTSCLYFVLHTVPVAYIMRKVQGDFATLVVV